VESFPLGRYLLADIVWISFAIIETLQMALSSRG
jgi:hypothetical protein